MPRTVVLFALLLPLGACGSGSVDIEGTLLEPGSAQAVSVAEAAASPFAITDESFLVPDLRGDSIELRFDHGDGDESVMRIAGLSGVSRLVLGGVWFDDGLAFADVVEVDGGATVRVNGLRMGAAEGVEGDTELAGTVLALSRADGTFLMRPHDPDIPDIRVLLGVDAPIRTPEGEPTELGRLDFGGTVTVRGVGDSGYLLATEIEASIRESERVEVELLGIPIDALERELERRDRDNERRDEAERRGDRDDSDRRDRGRRSGGRGGPPGRRD